MPGRAWIGIAGALWTLRRPLAKARPCSAGPILEGPRHRTASAPRPGYRPAAWRSYEGGTSMAGSPVHVRPAILRHPSRYRAADPGEGDRAEAAEAVNALPVPSALQPVKRRTGS